MKTTSNFGEEDFKDGISEREAYIHSLYYVALSSTPGAVESTVTKFIGDIRRYADELYPDG